MISVSHLRQTANLKVLLVACNIASFASVAFMFIPPAEARAFTTYERGMDEFGLRNFSKSTAIFENAVKEKPEDTDAWTELGRSYMMEDKYPDSHRASSRAIELDPKNFRAYTFRAFANFQLRKIVDGLRDSDLAIKYYEINPFDPSLIWALQNRARAYKLVHRQDLANADLELLQTYELLDKAVKAREWARLNDAVNITDQALKNLPRNPDLWFFRGVVNSNRRDFWTAAADFSSAIRNSPNTWFLYYFRADVYQQLNQYREAVKDLTTLINANPRLAAFRFTCETGRLRDQGLRNDMAVITVGDAHYLRAVCLAELGRFNEAIEDLNEALKLDPTDTKALSLRAEFISETGKDDAAINDFSAAIKQNPKDWTKYQLRGNAYLKLGKVKEAMQDFSEIIKQNPKDPGSYLIRALARERNADFEGALADYSEVVKLTPNDDDAYLARANCLRTLKRYNEALEDLAQAEKINPENKSLVSEERAKLYVETGEESLARAQTSKLDSALAAKRPNYLLFGGIAAGVLVSIGLAFLVMRKRRKK